MTCLRRNIGFLVLLGWIALSLFVRSRMRFPWLVLVPEEMEVEGRPYRESLTSRTRCVWGNTVAHVVFGWTLMTPLHENQKDLSIASRAKPSKPIPPPSVFWVGHLFQPFFISWCVDCLFCKCHQTQASLSSVTGIGS